MKVLTKDNEIVEGEGVSEGLAKFVDDVNSGMTGITMYSHQKREIIKYMIENFELSLKPQVAYVAPVEDVIYPEPKSLPIVETPDDGIMF